MSDSKLHIIADFIANINRNISIVCLSVTVLLSFVEVVVRKAIGVSIITMNEVGGIGMYLFVTFSISYIYHKEQHLSTGIMVDHLPEKQQYILNTFLHLLTLLFACLITHLWWKMFLSTFESERYYRMTGIKEWPFHLLGSIAWGMLGFTAASKFVMNIKHEETSKQRNQ